MTRFERQLTELIPRLRRYARALCGPDGHAADDLVQDCLERALQRRHQWMPGTNLRAWLFTIMHNLYVNGVRRHVNGPDFVALENDRADPDNQRPDRAVVIDELERALLTLPEDQRSILLLVSLEGLRYREVAEILDVPEGTVMSRLSRARQRLRDYLADGRTTHLRRVK